MQESISAFRDNKKHLFCDLPSFHCFLEFSMHPHSSFPLTIHQLMDKKRLASWQQNYGSKACSFKDDYAWGIWKSFVSPIKEWVYHNCHFHYYKEHKISRQMALFIIQSVLYLWYLKVLWPLFHLSLNVSSVSNNTLGLFSQQQIVVFMCIWILDALK